MLRDGRTSELVGLPQDLADLAEVLAELLTSRLKETLITAFATEVKEVRSDLLNALKDLKSDSRIDELESVVGYSGDNGKPKTFLRKCSPSKVVMFGKRNSSRSSFDVDVSPAITSLSSASCRSPSPSSVPARNAKRRLPSHSLEKQLAEKVIATKLLNTPGNSFGQGPHSTPSWRRQTTLNSEAPSSHSTSLWRRQNTTTSEGQASQSTNPTRRISFEQVVPADPEQAMTKNNSEDTSRAMANMGTGTIANSGMTTSLVNDPFGRRGSEVTIVPIAWQGQPGNSQSARVPVDNSEDAPNGIVSDTSLLVNWRSSVSSQLRRFSRIDSNTNLVRWRNEAKRFYDREQHGLVDESWGLARRINSISSRALALLPWDMRFWWLSKLYQLFFLVALILSTVSVVTRLCTRGIEVNEKALTIHIDSTLAIGSLLVFLASSWKNNAYVESNFLVEAYISRAGFLEELNLKSCMEIGALLIIWLSCVVSRCYAHDFQLDLHEFGFMFNILTLLGTCAYASRLCRGLHFIIDSYCQYMAERPFEFEDAMQEWFLLHCTIRTACASLQLCFVALQLTAIGTLLFGAASIYITNGVIDHLTVATCLPGALCLLVFLQLSMRAALVSDLCRRVPMLVNSYNAEFDLKRMYLVQYIVHCETGFYIFEVRITSALLLKMFYIACAATLGLLTQALRLLS